MENCLGIQYKQGVGLLNTINIKVLNAGNFKIAEKIVGKQGLLNKAKVYTGFNPAYAQYITQQAKYLAVFDYDTDVQLDIHNIFTLGGKVTPEEWLIQKKIMAGAMVNAQKRTRAEREKKSFWTSPAFGWLTLMIAAVLFFYFWTHVNPNYATVTVKVVNGTYTQAVNPAGGNTGVGGVVGAAVGAGEGAYNAITGGIGTVSSATKNNNRSIIP